VAGFSISIYRYRAQWVLTGEEPKLKHAGKNQKLSEEHNRVIMQLEKMSDAQILAVLAFIESLEKIEAIFSKQQ
jgi:hypothetical protein